MMTPQNIQDLTQGLEQLQEAYEAFRQIQEREHAHLHRRGGIMEWNVIVREKREAHAMALSLENQLASLRKRWVEMGTARQSGPYAAIRDRLARVQNLLTRILSCERMNETMLYHGGYLQSVVAFRSAREGMAV